MNSIGEFKGPQAIMTRMQEIQGKLDSVFGPSFQSHLAATTSLQGEIGNQPLSPFGPGMSICGKASPELKQMISQAAKQNGVDENMLDALVSTESNYNPGARSHSGALGLCQLIAGNGAVPGRCQRFGPCPES